MSDGRRMNTSDHVVFVLRITRFTRRLSKCKPQDHVCCKDHIRRNDDRKSGNLTITALSDWPRLKIGSDLFLSVFVYTVERQRVEATQERLIRFTVSHSTQSPWFENHLAYISENRLQTTAQPNIANIWSKTFWAPECNLLLNHATLCNLPRKQIMYDTSFQLLENN